MVVASLSPTTGSALAFLIARYLARGAVEKRAQKNDKFKAIDSAFGEQGWKIVGLLRLSPLIPFNLSNYFSDKHQVLAVRFGKLDWDAAWNSALRLFRSRRKSHVQGEHERTSNEYVFLRVGLVATVVVTAYVTRLAKKTLKQKKGAEFVENK